MTIRVIEDLHPLKVKLENFVGPLDLLLFLAHENEIDPRDIPVSNVVEQYIQLINELKVRKIDIASEFIVLAAQLMLLKVRAIAPLNAPVEEEEEDIDNGEFSVELIKKVLQYRTYKSIAARLEQRMFLFEKMAGRPELRLTDEDADLQEMEVWTLAKAYGKITKGIQPDPRLDIMYQDFPIEDMFRSILAVLQQRPKVRYSELLTTKTRHFVIAVFLASLELAKQQTVDLVQASDESDIIISKLESPPQVPAA